MRYSVYTLLLSQFAILPQTLLATTYGEQLCQRAEYHCQTIKPSDNWFALFPNSEQRALVMKINRINTRLQAQQVIAVPHDLANTNHFEHAPFARYIDPPAEKIVFVSQQHLAWAAYDRDGSLINWGPVSTGTDKCSDSAGDCITPGGRYHITRKAGISCISSRFPIRANGASGGAAMPYCMYFHGGYALHGSNVLPGHRASHGCIRLFVEDARWLNEEFIELPYGQFPGTKVIITPMNRQP